MAYSSTFRRLTEMRRRKLMLEWLTPDRVDTINALRERAGDVEQSRDVICSGLVRCSPGVAEAFQKRIEASPVFVTKAVWIEMYGGSQLLKREGFEVVPCVVCEDHLCKGWRVQKASV